MQQTLRHVDDFWGGARSYLEMHGVTAKQINALAQRILTV
jgi:hypothetical protein